MVDAERLARLLRDVTDDLAEALAGTVGFRNVLVDRYVDVDDRVVVEHLRHLDRLDGFVTALQDLL